jgi:hypothetical protein
MNSQEGGPFHCRGSKKMNRQLTTSNFYADDNIDDGYDDLSINILY